MSKHMRHAKQIVSYLANIGPLTNHQLSRLLGVVNPASRTSDARKMKAPIRDRWVKRGDTKVKVYYIGSKKAARDWLKAHA